MLKKIDFDNADLGIIGIVLIIMTLIIAAALSSKISFTQIAGTVDNLLYIFAAIITPGGLQKVIKGGQVLKEKMLTSNQVTPLKPEEEEEAA